MTFTIIERWIDHLWMLLALFCNIYGSKKFERKWKERMKEKVKKEKNRIRLNGIIFIFYFKFILTHQYKDK